MPWKKSDVLPEPLDYVIFRNAAGQYYIGWYDNGIFVHAPSGELHNVEEVKAWNYLDDVVNESIKYGALIQFIQTNDEGMIHV